MAYYIFLKSLGSLEEFRKNLHIKIPPKSPCANFQSLGILKKSNFYSEKNYPSNSGPVGPATCQPVWPFSPRGPPLVPSSSFGRASRAPPPSHTPPRWSFVDRTDGWVNFLGLRPKKRESWRGSFMDSVGHLTSSPTPTHTHVFSNHCNGYGRLKAVDVRSSADHRKIEPSTVQTWTWFQNRRGSWFLRLPFFLFN
jgi:hypothetical protein